MITIDIWSDFACPYCYIGETRLANAIENLGLTDKVKIVYHAYELDPSAPTEPASATEHRFAYKYRLTPEQARYQIEQISQLGRDLGIDFRYATTRYSNTRDAHRLMKLAEDRYSDDTVAELNRLLFDAYFTKNEVLSDFKVLTAIATQAGIDGADVAEVLGSDKYGHEVLADEFAAEKHGIRGVPYMIFNDNVSIPGATSTEVLEDLLKREVSRKGLDKPLHDIEPHACGRKGCDVV